MTNKAMLFAGLSCVAATCGVGILNLPSAIGKTGLLVAVLPFLFGYFGTYYTGWQLYSLVEELVFDSPVDSPRRGRLGSATRDPEKVPLVIDNHNQGSPSLTRTEAPQKIPYVEVARLVLGPVCGWIVRILIILNALLSNSIFIIIVAQNVKLLGAPLSERCLVLVVAGVAIPCSYAFGHIKDSSWYIILAVVSTFVATVILWWTVFPNAPKPEDLPPTPPFKWSTFAQTFGSIMFSFGGHTTFPTYQAQMESAHKRFLESLTCAYLYMAVVLVLFAFVIPTMYGTTVADNLIVTLPESHATVAVNILMTIHVFTALAAWIPPLSDMLSHLVIEDLGCGRFGAVGFKFLFPLTVCTAASVVAYSFYDSLGITIAFLGSTAIGLLTFVLPPVFYICRLHQTQSHIPLLDVLGSVLMVVGGLAALVYTLFDSFSSIFGNEND